MCVQPKWWRKKKRVWGQLHVRCNTRANIGCNTAERKIDLQMWTGSYWLVVWTVKNDWAVRANPSERKKAKLTAFGRFESRNWFDTNKSTCNNTTRFEFPAKRYWDVRSDRQRGEGGLLHAINQNCLICIPRKCSDVTRWGFAGRERKIEGEKNKFNIIYPVGFFFQLDVLPHCGVLHSNI